MTEPQNYTRYLAKLVACLLMFHWPKNVLQPSPRSTCWWIQQGSVPCHKDGERQRETERKSSTDWRWLYYSSYITCIESSFLYSMIRLQIEQDMNVQITLLILHQIYSWLLQSLIMPLPSSRPLCIFFKTLTSHLQVLKTTLIYLADTVRTTVMVQWTWHGLCLQRISREKENHLKSG